jgi:hypothetical protein
MRNSTFLMSRLLLARASCCAGVSSTAAEVVVE